ncbi:MAG: argininosuccinate synthase [Candidatus Eisenbacteria bacterium]|nr:argininosuccinate synthase [Candidatus Eisenbacteria bacterium]
MSKETVVLAYSGGLDTSCILKWLELEGFRVIAYIADVGQKDDFEEIAVRARATGADEVEVHDLKREFVTDYIYPAIRGDAVYEGRYLLGTALARPIIAKRQVEVARKHGAGWVSHGATGKGNDQVRFELAYAALAPRMKVLAPWKEPRFLQKFQGRRDLIAFAEEHGIPIPVTLEKPFSTDENLMHKSYESGILEDPMLQPDPSIFTVCKSPKDAPDEETLLEIDFKDGYPKRVHNLATGEEVFDPLSIFEYLNEVGGRNGIGRIDIVENRFVGIKSRGIYETPGGTILHEALRDLEGIAMDKEVLRLRNRLAPELAATIYNGFWFSPEMDFLMAAVEKSQELIDGTVRLSLYKGNVRPVGRTSPSSLYDPELASMDIAGGFDQSDSAGFIRVNALRLKAHRVIVRRAGENAVCHEEGI